MVRPAGFEPATYGFEVRNSIQLSYRRAKIKINGVSDGARTRDIWSHIPGLYQLSYAHHDWPSLLIAT